MNKYVLSVPGLGSCLFISLRLALEIAQVLSETSDAEVCLLGNCEHVALDAQLLRARIVRWYEDAKEPVPQLGKFDESTGEVWTRGVILSTELAKTDQGATSDGISKYLQSIRGGGWGSTPEYTAFAMISGRAIKVWTRRDGDIKCVDFIAGKSPQLNLFFQNKHYEPMITEEQKVVLEKTCKMSLSLLK
jgi:hypothetical protein